MIRRHRTENGTAALCVEGAHQSRAVRQYFTPCLKSAEGWIASCGQVSVRAPVPSRSPPLGVR